MATSLKFPFKVPLLQTYPLQLSIVISSLEIAAAPAEDNLPLIPPVQVARSVN